MTLYPMKDAVVVRDNREYIASGPEESLRRFTEFVGSCDETAPTRILRKTPEAVEEIIFEADIDGDRYYVVRSRPEVAGRAILSPRELAIARLIAKGLPNKCIGDILDISPWTVATHLRRIFAKLEVTSRAAAVARLGEENLL